MTDYYSILGVTEDASAQDIKQAFRTKAFEHHPDAYVSLLHTLHHNT